MVSMNIGCWQSLLQSNHLEPIGIRKTWPSQPNEWMFHVIIHWCPLNTIQIHRFSQKIAVAPHTLLRVLFADDTNLFSSGKDLTVLQDIFNEELKEISIWLKVNKLSRNVKNIHFMVISSKKGQSQISVFILKVIWLTKSLVQNFWVCS